MKRPRNLVYAVNERPPTAPMLVLGLQHAALSIVFLVYAAMVAKGAGFTLEQQQGMVVGTLLACGVGAILQGGFPRFSSGLLLIPLSSPMFVIFAIPAGKLTGPDGVAALTLVGGLVQILVGLTFRRLRAFFPPEVCGVVVLMLGVSMVPHAFDKLVAPAATGIYLPSVITGLVTLATIIACTIWLKGSKRFFAMLLGCAAGYAAAALGELGSFAEVVGQASMVDLPQLRMPSLSLEPSFLAGYAIVAMIAAVDNMGVIISTDRLDDAEWSRPDVGQISRGVSSLGATTIFSSLLGGTHLGLSSTNIGLAFATGVTSRVVGITAGLIMAGIAFFPAALALVIAMPDPVLGGILAFAASYFIVAGAQLSLSRMMSPRRMLVVGLPIATGIAVLTTSRLGVGMTGIAAILIQSPLMSASIVAIVLNGLMRIGIAQKATITLVSGAGRHEQVEEALTEWGEMWGLKPATALNASSAVNQLLESVADLAEGDIRLEARHDDVRLDLSVLYSGQPMAFPDRAPTADELMNDDDAMGRMAGWLVRNLADRATAFRRGDEQGVLLRFEG